MLNVFMYILANYSGELLLILLLNTLWPRQDGRHFPDDVFKWIFLNENGWISVKISLKFVPRVPINNIWALVQIMAWRRSGDKPLSEPLMASLLSHICVTRPQWVKHIQRHEENGWQFVDNIFLFHFLQGKFVSFDSNSAAVWSGGSS